MNAGARRYRCCEPPLISSDGFDQNPRGKQGVADDLLHRTKCSRLITTAGNQWYDIYLLLMFDNGTFIQAKMVKVHQ